MSGKKVAILGASPNKERYSYKAMEQLLEHNHEVFLVNKKYSTIEGRKVFSSLRDLKKVKDLNDTNSHIDAITVYLRPEISSTLTQDILEIRPQIVIFNPGSENSALQQTLEENKINVIEACTLVLLSTNQFDGIM